MVIPCRLCTAFEQEGEVLMEQIQKYLCSISDELKVEEELYHKRLEKCDTCEAMHGGLCKYCGCFVVVRAIKKQLSCPHPGGSCW